MNTWYGKLPEPTVKKFTFLEWLRICLRAFFIILLICVNLIIFVLLRFVEKYLSNLKLSYKIVKLVSRTTLRTLKIKLIVHGLPMIENGCVVANHVSWLDIFSLSSVQNIVFVSKLSMEILASSDNNKGNESPIGDAVAILPAIVATFLI